MLLSLLLLCYSLLFSLTDYYLVRKMIFKVLFISGKILLTLCICMSLFILFFPFYIDNLHIGGLQIMMFPFQPLYLFFFLFYSFDQDLSKY